MIEKSDDRVWIYSNISKKYHLLGAGITSLRESYRSTLLETPNIHTGFCGREILYHTGQLEFDGFWVQDTAQEVLRSKALKRGVQELVTVIIANNNGHLSDTYYDARRVRGYVCLENPGSGESPYGSRIKGKIVYAEAPEEGIFNESTQNFG